MSKERLETQPWFNMWFHPAKTIRDVVDFNPMYGFYWLASILGFGLLLSYSQTFSLGEMIPVGVIALVCLVLSVLAGWISIAIQSWFLTFIGRWFGGVAPYSHVKSAVAWSNLPNILNVLAWIILISVFGGDVFSSNFIANIEASPAKGVLLIVFLFQFVQTVWSLILQIASLAEVHQYSIWRSIITVIIAALIAIAITALVFAVVNIAVSGPEQAIQ